MILKNSLYTIIHQQREEQAASFCVQLNAAHTIYQAHFPGEPITPGVCIIQIAKELLEEYVGEPLDVQRVKNVKFLQVISPVTTPQVTYRLLKVTPEEHGYKAQVEVTAGDSDLTKMSFFCSQR